MTPMLPMTANGLAIILSATQLIMYPPDAATCSTAIVSFKPLSLRRTNCPAASPYPVTVPPPEDKTTSASSPGFALRITPVISSRSSFSWDAWTSPGKFITNSDFWRVASEPPSLRSADRGRASMLDRRLPAPRTAISPSSALRTAMARLGPTAARTCWIRSSSRTFSSVCSLVVSLMSSSFLGASFFLIALSAFWSFAEDAAASFMAFLFCRAISSFEEDAEVSVVFVTT
mmetsp:Transcript_2262/g.4858  ORF Transcript_2262/g.4858 Transcript_2262/m.4858 type:complete len:231 (-) Transcript_2262:1115-1807(-)